MKRDREKREERREKREKREGRREKGEGRRREKRGPATLATLIILPLLLFPHSVKLNG